MDRTVVRWSLAATALLSGCFGAPDLIGRVCSDLDPCPTDLVCQDNRCRLPCTADDECASLNDRCIEGMCRSPLVSEDAGTNPADKCRNVECVDPPPSECVDGDTVFRAYSGVGFCHPATGECEYTEIETTCPRCTATCLAPCESVRCDETNGGCRLDGFCIPGELGEIPSCRYTAAEDGTDCMRRDQAAQPIPGVCRAGECAECNVPEDCDDQNPCTDDMCDPTNGTCRHQNNNLRCDDTDLCTTSPGMCVEGQCVFSARTSCETPPDDCHERIGMCDPASGRCEYRPKANGTSCSDGNACTRVDSCRNGSCTGADPVACNNSPGQCWSGAGTCDPANGSCDYSPLPSGTGCTADANICTADACDGGGTCTAVRRVAPNNPSATQSVDSVTMRWNACTDAVHYDVAVEIQDTTGAWTFYYTYDENNPAAATTNEKVFYPVTCDRLYRFRVRAFNGSTHDPWSGFFDFYFAC